MTPPRTPATLTQPVPFAAERFEILPSIDIRGGRVVDLYQGDYNQETIYQDTAQEVARRFVAAGAQWIHAVDLDGSRAGSSENNAIIRQIADVATAAGARLELGGGIRSLDAARRALDLGASRVILGTAAVEHPYLVEQAVAALGAAAVIVGIDARGGRVAVRGWTAASTLLAVDLARRVASQGVQRIIYTDIARDSTLTEPNFAELDAVAAAAALTVIASGGVTTIPQVERLAQMPLEGAIIGSALYAGKITVEAALAAATRGRPSLP